MEGNQEDVIEVESINETGTPKKNIKDFKEEMQIVFIVTLIIGLILGSMLWFSVLKPKPIYQQYEKYEGDYNTTYENRELNVRIIESPDSEGTNDYYLEFTNIYGEYESHFALTKSERTFFDCNVLSNAYKLSINQIKWFEFMYYNVL